MNKPKRQSKQPLFNFKIFYTTVILGYVLLITFFGFNHHNTQTITANPIAKPATLPLLTDNFLLPSAIASESPEISFPVTTQLEQSLLPNETASTAATPTPEPDYCIDLPIVMYHHIQPLPIAEQLGHAQLTVDAAIFDEQMKYLKDNGYTAISSDDLVTALHNRQPLPAKSIMITIDDGYDDNYTYAFLSAKKYSLLMNFFIPTGLIDTPGYMNWDHLTEMAHNPYARIYNHTTTHSALAADSKEQIIQEVTNADQEFEKRLGVKSTIVAYPYGSYNDLAIATLIELGEQAAISTDPGRQQCVSTIMRLPRLRVGNMPMASYGY